MTSQPSVAPSVDLPDSSVGRARSSFKPRIAGLHGHRFDVFFAAFWTNVLSLALPIVILQVYDRVIPNASMHSLVLFVAGLGCVLVVDAVLNLVRSYLTAWCSARVQHVLGCAAVRRMLETDIKSLEAEGPGARLQRLRSIESLRSFYAGQEIHLLIDLPFAFLFIGLIAMVAWELAAVQLAVIAVLVGAAVLSGLALRQSLERRSRTDEQRHNFVLEVLNGIHTIKSIGAEALMARRYERLQSSSAETTYWVALFSAIARIIGATFSQMTIVVIGAFGSTLVMDGRISVGALAACTFLAGRAAQPLLRALGVWTQFQNVRIARDQVRAIFDLPTDDRDDVAVGHAIGGALRLDGVSFGYGADRSGVLDDISLAVEPGEAIGITGNNGAGKTTLLWLVLGLLKPNAGRVLMDDMDVRRHDPAMLRRHVAYLPQNGVLFQGTILENLTMFDASHADRAKRIAAQLGLAEIIGRLPKGYDTVLNDSPDEGLPVGVRQRIAIARALVPLEEPRLIVFDEANGYLDQASDEMFRRLLVDLRGHCTLVLASHRPSYLALADRVYVLRNGKLQPPAGGARESLQALEAGLSA